MLRKIMNVRHLPDNTTQEGNQMRVFCGRATLSMKAASTVAKTLSSRINWMVCGWLEKIRCVFKNKKLVKSMKYKRINF